MTAALGIVESPNEKLVRSFLAAMGRTDIESLSDLLAEDATWWLAGELPVSGLYEGKAAIVGEFLPSAAALFEQGSLGFELRNVMSDGEAIIAEYVGTGTGTSQRPYHNQYCTIFQCHGGKIRSIREYLDTAHVYGALYPAISE
ncbi:nuclear transport factor 2 family protein [Paenarthrobacter aromaticivorans]|uniref:nuclear transport factor 2 family protein n=1 Tax=Paenarthrobacter aromaticivorans TaxID=2849150 RepID=UPI003A80EC7C